MRRRGVRKAPVGRVVAAVISAVGCEADRGVTPGPATEILWSAVAAGEHNVLSALVTTRVMFADSAAVQFGIVGTGLESTTPAVIVEGDSAVVPVLGLFPDVEYRFRAVVYGPGQVVVGEQVGLRTGTLPPDLPTFATSGPDPAPGFVVFAAGTYGLVIDNAGRVVWYHRFPTGVGLNFMPQPNGRYVARPKDRWIEVDVLGNVKRNLGCVGNHQPRLHDLIALSDGSYWIMCDDTRVVDLSQSGGSAAAHVTATAVQHVGVNGELLFRWTAFDHFDLLDLDLANRSGPDVNWTHGNGIDLDTDGNLLISFRNLSEIAKIDTHAGAVLWRLGGVRNQFTFENVALPAFSRQHGLRVVAPGEIVLLDNLGDPVESRGERYAIDAASRTARRIGSYGSQPAVVALLGGSAQSLGGGRTLVSFGNGGRVEEYDTHGNVVWRIEGNAGYVFRAQRTSSLYDPGR